MSLTLGSLFAGIGGFDLGFERAGFKTLWQCEIDKAAQGVLRRHFPEAQLHSDVREVGAHNLAPVDVLTFGSPCFPAGVLVLTRRGLIAIEEVVVGDEVVSHLGRWQPVVRVGSKVAPTLRLKGQGHPGLVTTEEHPFWASAVEHDGSLSLQEWVPAKDMKGQMWAQLMRVPAEAEKHYEQVCQPMSGTLHQGYRMGLVRECALTGVEERVYNIEVEGDHSYTADGIIVHNCQDVSLAGKRAGLAGERSGLFHEAVRVIRELREHYGKPDFAIWENVPGALTSRGGADFATVLQALADIGAADIAWRVLDSQWFGVPQRRRRIFLVADFGGERAGQILSLSQGGSWDSSTGGTKKREVAKALDGSTRKGAWWDGSDIADCLDLSMLVKGQMLPEKRRFPVVYGNADRLRRLTPLEIERCFGFPDEWTAPQLDTPRYRQLGNSIAAPVAQWVAGRLSSVQLARGSEEWRPVVFSADCDEDGNCPVCAIDYGDCECFGPTQDGLEYEERDGVLYARRAP